VVLADNIAVHVTPIYEIAAAGEAVSFFPAWVAAIGFTLQIYFDFSGYSDMALGLARCIGIRLPPNFDSPLKATSIIDFWLRWHMTLTRFLTAYLYNPLVLWLTRRRMEKGLPGLGGKRPSYSAFFQLLAGPTLFTMLISGLWHGAGYLFILWGLLHGVYLVINHAWRLLAPRLGRSNERDGRRGELIGFCLTFFSVVVAMVLFRSTSVAGAVIVLQGMIGAHGVSLPQEIMEHLGPFSQFVAPFVSLSPAQSGRDFLLECLGGAVLLSIALFLPNSLEVTARYEPTLGMQPRPYKNAALAWLCEWKPTFPWALATAVLAGIVIMQWGGKSEFLYWQF
jgi:D-alanyl-lipoteichoic acid acyltransferase DltB (MBOAT superfamily)